MDHIFFDTNIIIRFLTGDDLKKQAATGTDGVIMILVSLLSI
jgi:hypothetical protein